jgi:hypothetical protein
VVVPALPGRLPSRGAGTTAAGLRAWRPTVVVPFFGDHFLWGQVVAAAGAGPPPLPIDRVDSDALAEAFAACRHANVLERASALGDAVRATDGVELVAQSVYRHLPLHVMSCSNEPDRLASVSCETCGQRLCRDCWHSLHSGHVVHPHRYVDWSARAGHGLAREISELLVDAAQALHAGFAEILPPVVPRGQDLVVTDGDPSQPPETVTARADGFPATRD